MIWRILLCPDQRKPKLRRRRFKKHWRLNWKAVKGSSRREKIARELFQNLDKQGRGRAQKELMTALLIDAENYSGVASTQLKRAVNIWHRGGIQIDKFNKDAMASLFAKETFDPYKISETIPKMTPSRIKGMHEAMRKIPGGEQAWNDMTAAYIYRAMDKSSQHPERLDRKST